MDLNFAIIFLLIFNDNIYHDGDISKMANFDFFLSFGKQKTPVKVDLMVNS